MSQQSITERLKQPILAVRTDSWHYRYFLWIRQVYALDKQPVRTSLCPYVQTMIWLSFAGVILSPLIITTFVGYKLLDLLLTAIDNADLKSQSKPKKFGKIDRWLVGLNDKVASVLSSSPIDKAIVGVAILIVGSLVVGMGIFVYIGILFFTYKALPAIIHEIPKIPHHLYVFIIATGNAIFLGFATIGWIASETASCLCYGVKWLYAHVSHGLVWFFTNKALWLGIAHYGIISLAVGALLLFICYIAYEIISSPWMQQRKKNWEEKSEARRNRIRERQALLQEQRREELRKKAEAEYLAEEEYIHRQWKDKSIDVKPTTPKWHDKLMEWLSNYIGNIKRNIFSSTESVGETTYKMVGIISVFGTFLWALKKQACPIVTFIAPEELERQKITAKEEALATIEANRKKYQDQQDKLFDFCGELQKHEEAMLAAGRREPENKNAILAANRQNFLNSFKEDEVVDACRHCRGQKIETVPACGWCGRMEGTTKKAPFVKCCHNDGCHGKCIIGQIGCGRCKKTYCRSDCQREGETTEEWQIRYTAYMQKHGNYPCDNQVTSSTKQQEEKPSSKALDCPECGKAMVRRIGKYGKFLGCTGFPKCRHSCDIPASDRFYRQKTGNNIAGPIAPDNRGDADYGPHTSIASPKVTASTTTRCRWCGAMAYMPEKSICNHCQYRDANSEPE